MVHYAQGVNYLYLFPFGVTRAGIIITFFFLLSGFGLFVGYQKRERIKFGEYLFKRSTRILPFYHLALLMMAVLLLAAGRFSITEFILSALCLQPWIPHYQHAINPPSWFIADLIFFYLAFPIIFSFIKKNSPDSTKLLGASLLLWIGSVLFLNKVLGGLPEGYYNFIDCFPLSHFPSFFMGICGAYFIVEKKKKGQAASRNSLFYTLFLLAVCSAIVFFHQGKVAEMIEERLPFEANLYAPICLLFIIQLSTARNYVTKILSHRFFGLLATISFPLYIFQAPIYSVYDYALSRIVELQPTPKFLLFFLLFMLFASLITAAESNFFKYLRERTSG